MHLSAVSFGGLRIASLHADSDLLSDREPASSLRDSAVLAFEEVASERQVLWPLERVLPLHQCWDQRLGALADTALVAVLLLEATHPATERCGVVLILGHADMGQWLKRFGAVSREIVRTAPVAQAAGRFGDGGA